ncbi:MAG TPA: DUF4124 domain-containing protein, partial [Marinobacter sp.]|nr:DUF4124 domain-containing protein [Marinobacter sp.]
YKWTDANGQVHFGDRPPAEKTAEEVAINAEPPGKDAAASERIRKMNEFLGQRQAEREVRQAEEAKIQRRAEMQEARCRKLKAQLKHMASVSTFYNLNEDGEKVFVSEEDNTRIRERFSQRVRQACGKS